MSFKDFRIQIAIRLMVVLFLLGGLSYYLFAELNLIRSFFFLLFAIAMTVSIFRYIVQSNRDTTSLLDAILNDDFTNKYSNTEKGQSFNKLYQAFNQINKKLSALSIERESQYQYLDTLIQQVNIGIISYDRNLLVQMHNRAFLELFSLERIVRIQDLDRVSPEIQSKFNELIVGRPDIFDIDLHGQNLRLSVGMTEFAIRGKFYKLITIQDISKELNVGEMQAWQKLIRVLTHEIMNSVAPIASLSTTMHHMTSGRDLDELSPNDLKNLTDGLQAVKERSTGLMKFAEDYRALTRIPLPNVVAVDSVGFFENIKTLFGATIQAAKIDFKMNLDVVPEEISIDRDLISQALINLLKNAKEAIEGNNIPNGKIDLNVNGSASNQVLIQIIDNGGGVPDELKDKIFVPFFTSKKTGSGIGLSVVRQIINLHNGSLDFKVKGQDTTFTIIL